MNAYHAAPWSPSSDDSRDRTTHHRKTKQHGQEEWTWEDILNGKGSWMWEEILAGRDRLLREQREAARRKQFYKGSRLAWKLILLRCSVLLKIMNAYHAAPWSPSLSDDSRDNSEVMYARLIQKCILTYWFPFKDKLTLTLSKTEIVQKY
jgi:hypothetical protein